MTLCDEIRAIDYPHTAALTRHIEPSNGTLQKEDSPTRSVNTTPGSIRVTCKILICHNDACRENRHINIDFSVTKCSECVVNLFNRKTYLSHNANLY